MFSLQCRAVAAGIFGIERYLADDQELVEFVALEAAERFEKLDDGTVDVLLAITTHTMDRAVFEVSALDLEL